MVVVVGGGGGSSSSSSSSRVVHSAFIYVHRRMCRLYIHVNNKEILPRMSC